MQELTIAAMIDNIPVVTQFVDDLLEEAGYPLKAQMQIDVAIDEVFSNIALYGYRENGGEATVQVSFLQEPACVCVTFIDSAPAYNPLAKEDPDVSLSAEERKIGGLGIYIVKKTMDSVSYEYRDGKNMLTIRKNR